MKKEEMNDIDIESTSELRFAELKDLLSNRGLPTSGLKEQLVKGLREATEMEQSVVDVNSENLPEGNEWVGEIGEQVDPERNEKSEVNLNKLLEVMMQMNSGIKQN